MKKTKKKKASASYNEANRKALERKADDWMDDDEKKKRGLSIRKLFLILV